MFSFPLGSDLSRISSCCFRFLHEIATQHSFHMTSVSLEVSTLSPSLLFITVHFRIKLPASNNGNEYKNFWFRRLNVTGTVWYSFNYLDGTCKSQYVELLSNFISLVSAFISSPNMKHNSYSSF